MAQNEGQEGGEVIGWRGDRDEEGEEGWRAVRRWSW